MVGILEIRRKQNLVACLILTLSYRGQKTYLLRWIGVSLRPWFYLLILGHTCRVRCLSHFEFENLPKTHQSLNTKTDQSLGLAWNLTNPHPGNLHAEKFLPHVILYKPVSCSVSCCFPPKQRQSPLVSFPINTFCAVCCIVWRHGTFWHPIVRTPFPSEL